MEGKYITSDQIKTLKSFGDSFTMETEEGIKFELSFTDPYWSSYMKLELIVSNPKWRGELKGVFSLTEESNLKIKEFKLVDDSYKDVVITKEMTDHLIDLFFTVFNDDEIKKMREEEIKEATDDFFNGKSLEEEKKREEKPSKKILVNVKKFFSKLKEKIEKIIKDE